MLLPVFHIRSHGIYSPGGRHVLVTMGLINGAPISVGKSRVESFLARSDRKHYWRVIFGVVITWYLHIYVVERDRAALNLPQYELRDEQQRIESRFKSCTEKSPRMEDEVVHTNKFDDSEESEEIQAPEDFTSSL